MVNGNIKTREATFDNKNDMAWDIKKKIPKTNLSRDREAFSQIVSEAAWTSSAG